MEFPAELKYASTDEWVRVEGDVATVGITDYAQHELGEVVYLELPAVGNNVKKGAAFGVVESVKAVSDLNSPVSGQVIESNLPLADEPGGINESPYENGWLIKVRLADDAEINDLMDAETYKSYRS
ncbi:MAG TPA: glycine cleavage system protein GcvH [Abditibacteriaceae bacterium]|jgi:glycine cleavage system H protein